MSKTVEKITEAVVSTPAEKAGRTMYFPDTGYVVPPNPVYDSIVRREDFKRIQEQNRTMRLAQSAGLAGDGVFDSEPDNVNPFMLAIRSGTLTRADVSTLQRGLEALAKSEDANAKSLAKKLDLDSKAEKRQAKIDEVLGVASDKEEAAPAPSPAS